MAENYVMHVSEDGVVTQTPMPSDQERESRIGDIIKMIHDENAPLAPIKRLIAEEIATATQIMIAYSNSEMVVVDGLRVKALETQVKSLRELGKELMESDTLSKKDFLNWEGAKLRFVLEEYRRGLEDSLAKVGIDEATSQAVLRQWRDTMAELEPAIRRATEKIEKADVKDK